MTSGPGGVGGERGVDVTISGAEPEGPQAAELERAVVVTLEDAGVAEAEISVTLLDDAGIQELNARYLGKDRPTDVIAFPLGRVPVLVGDVYLGVDQARRQAGELGVPLREELVRLAVHGALHVLGHDHPEGDERMACPMFVLQEALVRRILG